MNSPVPFSYDKLATRIILEQDSQLSQAHGQSTCHVRNSNYQLPSEILACCCRALVVDGQKIQAIKLYLCIVALVYWLASGVMDAGLEDAKAAVEAL